MQAQEACGSGGKREWLDIFLCRVIADDDAGTDWETIYGVDQTHSHPPVGHYVREDDETPSDSCDRVVKVNMRVVNFFRQTA